MILFVIAILAVIGIIVGAVWLKAMGLALIRWWVVPTVCLLGLVGMPMTISTVYYPSMCKAAGDVYLAPWIIELWRNTGYLLGLGCFIIVSAFCFGLGVRFTCTQTQRKLLLAPIVVLCLASLFDTMLFLIFRNTNKGYIVAESISPNSSLRVLCNENNWLDTSFRIFVMDNVKRPLTCRHLPEIGLDIQRFGERSISWSADSQLMCVWADNVPVAIYDFTTAIMIQPQVSREDGISKEEADIQAQDQLTQQVTEMFAKHGGGYTATPIMHSGKYESVEQVGPPYAPQAARR